MPKQTKLRTFLVSQGISVAEFSRASNITYSALHRLLRGDGEPSLESVKGILRAARALQKNKDNEIIFEDLF